jgi:hypothetical protein
MGTMLPPGGRNWQLISPHCMKRVVVKKKSNLSLKIILKNTCNITTTYNKLQLMRFGNYFQNIFKVASLISLAWV